VIAWDKVGVHHVQDANAGAPMGLGEMVENWKNGKRQLASEAYRISSFSNITVMTETMVKRIIIEEQNGKKVATGVELGDDRSFKATKEVSDEPDFGKMPKKAALTPRLCRLSFRLGRIALLKC